MTDEVRRIARAARRMGLSATTMGNWNDAQWRDFRETAKCERATLHQLADAVDLIIRLERGQDAQWDAR